MDAKIYEINHRVTEMSAKDYELGVTKEQKKKIIEEILEKEYNIRF